MANFTHKLLKYLYFEGYANSYEEAEHLLSEMTGDEIDEISYLSRLPKGQLSEVSDEYMKRGAKSALQKALKRKREKEQRQRELANLARQKTQRSGNIIRISGSSKGKKGTIEWNKETNTRTFIPDEQ